MAGHDRTPSLPGFAALAAGDRISSSAGIFFAMNAPSHATIAPEIGS